MIRLLPALLAAVLATDAFAQSRFGSPSGFGNVNYPGTGHPPAAIGYSGFGNVNFPGTGHPPQMRPQGAISSPGYAGRLGATVAGYPAYTGVARGYAHPSHSRAAIVAVPVIVGGYGYPGYDPSMGAYYEDPNAVVQQQPAAPPVVIINQAYRPENRESRDVRLPGTAARCRGAPVRHASASAARAGRTCPQAG